MSYRRSKFGPRPAAHTRPPQNANSIADLPSAQPHHDPRLGPGDMIQILGRYDLSVNRNGLLLPFLDVEARLREIEGVEQAVVVAGSQGIRGRALVAFCVLARNAVLTADDVRERYAARSPAYSVPDSVRIVSSLPQLPSGKVDRVALANAVLL